MNKALLLSSQTLISLQTEIKKACDKCDGEETLESRL